MIVFCVFFVLCYDLVQAQFPRACVTDEAIKYKSCCPTWKDGSTCGSSSGRGICRDHIVPVPIHGQGDSGHVPQYNDDRLDWPQYYFDQACECFGYYSGYDCGDCKYGYFGEKCDRKITVVRKEIRELSLLERKRFFSYLALAKTTKSQDFVVLYTGDRHHKDTYRFVDATIYDVFAWIHYYSMKPILKNGTFDDTTNYAHQGPAFPGWHRLGLLFLERQIQLMTGDENFALPYWDWRGEGENCSICNDDFLGDNNVQGFLSRYSYFAFWKSICSGYNYDDSYCLVADDQNQMERLHRKPGTNPHAPSLPTFQDVEDALRWKDFDTPPYNIKAQRSFRNALEGFINPQDGKTQQCSMHNLVHLFLGGTMSQVPISANDPIFVLHHCFIDKIFEEWLRTHHETPDVYPKNDQPGQGPDECATPYFPCYNNKNLLRRSDEFGYIYSKNKPLVVLDKDDIVTMLKKAKYVGANANTITGGGKKELKPIKEDLKNLKGTIAIGQNKMFNESLKEASDSGSPLYREDLMMFLITFFLILIITKEDQVLSEAVKGNMESTSVLKHKTSVSSQDEAPPDKNVFSSPVGLSSALYEWEILESLTPNNDPGKKVHQLYSNRSQGWNEPKSKSGNVIFIHNSPTLPKNFQGDEQNGGRDRIMKVDFRHPKGAEKEINDYVKSKTEGEIKDVVQDLSKDTKMVLINYV